VEWLDLLEWILLATAVVGQVLVTDDGRIGRLLSGGQRLVRTQQPTGDESNGQTS
jgi:hypothetical protein